MVLNSITETSPNRQAIGAFPDRRSAEQALHELRDSGYPMERVSVIAHDGERGETLAGAEVVDRDGRGVDDQTGNKADDGAKVGAVSGGALGGLTGLLVGLGTLAIPGVGPIMLAGAAATALATTVAGSAIGAATGSLLGGLVGLGVPEERAKVYHDRVTAGEYLVMVDGSPSEIDRAEAILSHRGIQDWGVYGPVAGTQVDRTPDRITEVDPVLPATILPGTGLPGTGLPGAVLPGTGLPTTGLAPTMSADRDPTQPLQTPADDTIKLYEERLIVDKDRAKTGEVAIGKRVETETVQASIGLDKERVVIQRSTPGTEASVRPGDHPFQDSEVIRMEVYEEIPDIHKQAFVREELNIRKEVTESTATAEEVLRREELDVQTDGTPIVNTDRSLDNRR